MKIFKTKKYTILSGILKYSFIIVFAVMLLAPVVFAAPDGVDNTNNNSAGVDNTGTNITTKIENPLGDNIKDIPSFIKEIINIVLYIGIPIVALAIIYTGFLFVQAQGNSEKLTKAKNSLVYTLIGAALLLGAFVIADAIGKTVEDIKKTT
ncbi:MAG TPA: hypothetical protein VK153_02170 [Candidatus Paceibacterota bacterium]|nr:hypothetical protein [Candidatus Paceibacterota bacterium]